MEKNKNLLITIVLCGLIFFAWQYFFELPRQQAALKQQQEIAAQQASQPEQAPAAAAPGTPTAAAPASANPSQPAMTRDQALGQSPRVTIDTPRLKGSIALKGGRLDDLVLKDYHETVDPQSPNVVLLSPFGGPEGHLAEVGFTATDSAVKVPGYDTLWQSDGGTLSPTHPVTLSWDNGAGLTFKRTFSVDENYLFSVAQAVENKTSAPVALAPYARVVEFGLPKEFAQIAIREGVIGVLDGTLQGGGVFSNPWDYKHVKDHAIDNPGDAGIYSIPSKGGWIGITSKYWLVAAVIPNDAQVVGRAFYDPKLDSWQGDFTGQPISVAPGASATFKSDVFAGAKEVNVLTDYRDRVGVPLFERAIDFGLFFFLSKPLFLVLDAIYGVVGNFGIAILCLTVLVRLCLFPLANKSYASMNKMKTLQPKMAEMKEKFGDDKARMNQEMMALYKREKVNPAAGCLPILIQFPVFLALYKVLSVTIEMRHAPFFGWIKDLSAPDPTSFLNLFGLLPWHPADFAHVPVIGGILGVVSIGIWPLIMGFTMWAQMRMNPTPPDPVQAKMFALMPFIFTFMLAHNTVGLVIYWAWNNTLSIAQQRFIMWKLDKANKAKELKKAQNTPKDPVKPKNGKPKDVEVMSLPAAPSGTPRPVTDPDWLFAQEARFVAGAMTEDALPPPGAVEIAFAGRSNVGKSSLINALTGRNSLARVSRTPGRTQQINFFDLVGKLVLVDLPGHGYAQVGRAKVAEWSRLIAAYLKGRPNLARVMLLIDCRVGFKEPDLKLMALLDDAALSYQIVMTKADELEAGEIETHKARLAIQLERRPAAHPEILVTSSRKGAGIGAVRAAVAAIVDRT